MPNLSITAQKELRMAQNELMELSNRPSLTSMERRRFDSLLATVSLLKSGAISDEVRHSEADDLAKELGFSRVDRTAEARKRNEERAMLRKILSSQGEYRTYSPLASSGSAFVPQGFERVVEEAQMSAGILYAGSPLVSNTYATEENPGNPSKLPTVDDTASTGYVVDENTAETDVNYPLGNVTLTLQKMSTGILLYSMEISEDSFGPLSQVLGTAIGRRLGKIQNSTFQASLLTTLGSNSSASVSSAVASIISEEDVYELVGAVNAAYAQSPSAAFSMSRGAQKAIAKLQSSGGLPVFREVMAAEPKLLGFPVYISDYCDSVATGNKPILFGDWSAVYIKSLPLSVKVLTERFVDQGSYGVVGRKRAAMSYGIQATSDSALKYLFIS
jgi:HK97 family phage major capsid protein